MIQVYDNIFDKIFLLEEARWLLERCNWRVDNVAHRYTKPYGIEGEHRLMGTTIYNNFRGSAERYWEHIYKKDRKNGCTELEQFVGMYKTIQSVSKNKYLNLSLKWPILNFAPLSEGAHQSIQIILIFR